MSPVPPPAPPGYTAKQGQYLAFIYAYRGLHGRRLSRPTSSASSGSARRPVHQVILKLEQARLITRQPEIASSITVAINPKALPELDPRHDQPVKTTVTRY